MAFRAVLFDGYGTLFEDAFPNVLSVCDRMARDQDLGMTPEEVLAAWDKHWFPLVRGTNFITLRESHHVSLGRLFAELGVQDGTDRYVEDIFDRFSNSRTYGEVDSTLEALGVVVTGIVSNADADHLASALELNRLSFPVVVSSESAKCYKPATGIFYEATNALEVDPGETLYVGDSQEDDIVGARAAGMSVAWINRRGEALKEDIPEPDFEIANLSEVVGIVT